MMNHEKTTKLLSLYTRDIAVDDAGGSRTLVQLLNYLVETKEFKCYSTFRITAGADNRINQLPHIGLSVPEIHRFIESESIDILLVPEGYALSGTARQAARGTSCKIVSAFHNSPGYEKIGLLRQMYESLLFNPSMIKRVRALFLLLFYPLSYAVYTRKMMRSLNAAYNNSDVLVLLSERFFEEYRKCYRLDDTTNMKAIENALSFPTFAESKDIDNKKKTLLVVSRLDERHKRLSYVIRAWSKLHRDYPDWDLKIVGTGRSETLYHRLSSRLGNERISFLSHQPHPEKYYLEASIFLMTSAFEGWGMTITEAQQLGCVPLVMDSYAAVHDIITSGDNGLLSPNGDLAALEKNIRYLIDHPEQRNRMAKNGIQSCKRFNQDIVLNKWVSLFKSLG